MGPLDRTLSSTISCSRHSLTCLLTWLDWVLLGLDLGWSGVWPGPWAQQQYRTHLSVMIYNWNSLGWRMRVYCLRWGHTWTIRRVILSLKPNLLFIDKEWKMKTCVILTWECSCSLMKGDIKVIAMVYKVRNSKSVTFTSFIFLIQIQGQSYKSQPETL